MIPPDDREAIRALSAEIRRTLEGIAIPDDLAAAITRPLARLGEQAAYAIRSSATAEDLPTASFVGQQSRQITTLSPIPASGDRENPSGQSPNGSRVPGREATASGEAARVPEGNWHSENHVYVSVGHHQMMTDPMKPLGISLWQLTASGPMYEAGGRLFVDVTRGLASPASRAGLLKVLGR